MRSMSSTSSRRERAPRSRGSRSPAHRPSSGASAQWPQRGNQAQSTSDSALTINTAVVAGNQLIRLYGSLPADASDDTVAAVIAIETSIAFSTPRPSLKQMPAPRVSLAPVMHSASAADDTDDDDENDLTPPVSEGSPSASQPSTPGVATRILQGTAASEPEVAVSADGRNIVVAQQFVWTYSNDGGKTFTFGGSFPNSTGGDSSRARQRLAFRFVQSAQGPSRDASTRSPFPAATLRATPRRLLRR